MCKINYFKVYILYSVVITTCMLRELNEWFLLLYSCRGFQYKQLVHIHVYIAYLLQSFYWKTMLCSRVDTYSFHHSTLRLIFI
jgi:hypothetical protein